MNISWDWDILTDAYCEDNRNTFFHMAHDAAFEEGVHNDMSDQVMTHKKDKYYYIKIDDFIIPIIQNYTGNKILILNDRIDGGFTGAKFYSGPAMVLYLLRDTNESSSNDKSIRQIVKRYLLDSKHEDSLIRAANGYKHKHTKYCMPRDFAPTDITLISGLEPKNDEATAVEATASVEAMSDEKLEEIPTHSLLLRHYGDVLTKMLSADFNPQTRFPLPCSTETVKWFVDSIYEGEFELSKAPQKVDAVTLLDYLQILPRSKLIKELQDALMKDRDDNQ